MHHAQVDGDVAVQPVGLEDGHHLAQVVDGSPAQGVAGQLRGLVQHGQVAVEPGQAHQAIHHVLADRQLLQVHLHFQGVLFLCQAPHDPALLLTEPCLLHEAREEPRLAQLDLEVPQSGQLQCLNGQGDDLRVRLHAALAHQLHPGLIFHAQHGQRVRLEVGGRLHVAQPKGQLRIPEPSGRQAHRGDGGVRADGQHTAPAVECLPHMLGAVAVGLVVQHVIILQDRRFDFLVPVQGEQAAQFLLQASLAGTLTGQGVLHAGGYLRLAMLH